MIEPDAFIVQADELVKEVEPSEVNVRSALSRAYYSLYHVTYEVLKTRYQEKFIAAILEYAKNKNLSLKKERIEKFDENYINSNMSMHGTVYRTLRDINDVYGSDFWEFKNRRTEADYKLEMDFDVKREKERIQAIHDLIDKIRKL